MADDFLYALEEDEFQHEQAPPREDRNSDGGNERDDFDYADFEGDDIEYKAEVNAYDRAGPGGKLAELLETHDGKTVSPEDRFKISLHALGQNLISQGLLTHTDVDNMLEKTQFVTGLRFKNYVAFLLGYMASQGGRALKKDVVLNVINNVLPKIKEGGVYPPDVIRYARYWEQTLGSVGDT